MRLDSAMPPVFTVFYDAHGNTLTDSSGQRASMAPRTDASAKWQGPCLRSARPKRRNDGKAAKEKLITSR